MRMQETRGKRKEGKRRDETREKEKRGKRGRSGRRFFLNYYIVRFIFKILFGEIYEEVKLRREKRKGEKGRYVNHDRK